MDFANQTAAGAYGFMHGMVPVGSVQAVTQSGSEGAPTVVGAPSLSLGMDNPLFWLLLLVLLFTGWVFGAFDFMFGVKKIGSTRLSVKAH